MLTRLRVKNFKLLQDVNLELKCRNVFIGPNKSGKSTILQVLQFLQRVVTDSDVKKTCDNLNGFSEVLWKGIQPPSSIEIALEGQSSPDKTFNYELVIRGDSLGRVVIEREKLTINKNGTSYSLIEMLEGKGRGIDGSGQVLFRDTDSLSRPALSYEIPSWEAGELRKYILQWQFFNVLPALSRIVSSPSVAIGALDPSGAQLNAWLMTFQANYPDEFARVKEVAKQAFTYLESFSAFLTPGATTFLKFQEQGMQSPFSIAHASDGELKFLALLSIIFSPFPVPVVCIEEPENYLHPRLLEIVVDIANQRNLELEGQVSQVFATTHSPYLVDYLDPEDIVVVDRVRNHARLRRPANEGDLRELMRESQTSLGSLWFSGAMGGV